MWRSPIHIGARSAPSGTRKVLVAIPVFKGELVNELEMDLYASSTGSASNIDQALVFSWAGIFQPFDFGQSALASGVPLSATLIDAAFTEALEAVWNDPNPGATVVDADGFFGIGPKTLFTKNVIGSPVPVGKDSLNNTDAHMVDRLVWDIPLRAKATRSGVILVGIVNRPMVAQTDFGVAEVDADVDLNAIVQGYAKRMDAEDVGTIGKAAELFHGGDTYIEADTFKSETVKAYAVCKARIRMNDALRAKGQ